MYFEVSYTLKGNNLFNEATYGVYLSELIEYFN